MSAPSDHPTPYASAAGLYRAAGWTAPLPIEGKSLPPTGWTGKTGGWPSGADIQTWTEYDGHKNIGLRLPPTVLGIDVDNYDGKPGAANLARHVAMWGPLPDTWRSTSRTDEISGIRLYRIPENPDVQWHSLIEGGGIELVRWDHRYAMCWPSVHPSGRIYRWTRDNLVTINIPRPEELPYLPANWVLGLVKGPALHDDKADISSGPAFIRGMPGAALSPCRVMSGALARARAALSVSGSRHDDMCPLVQDMVRLADAGHPGGIGCLDDLGEWYVSLITDRDTETMVRAEYVRALTGACATVAAKRSWPPGSRGDPCTRVLPAVTSSVPGGSPLTLPQNSGEAAGNGEGATVSTWGERVDIGAALDGRLPAIPPAELSRVDGVRLLYPGKVNGLLGPSESGKTWIVLLAASQSVSAGRAVVIIDFEDTVIGLVERLRALGVADDLIRSHVVYLAPSEPLTLATQADLMNVLETVDPALVILDGVNAAMTTMGLDMNSNTDATNFHINLLLPMSRIGAAVVVVDHTPKNDHEGMSKGGIGAQAKRAAMTGAAIKVEVVKQFSRGHAGLLKLIVDKDRGGHVRMATTTGSVIGMAHLEPGEDGTLSVWIEPHEADENEAGEFRPTVLMGRVAQYLTECPGANARAIMAEHFGKDSGVRKAINALVDDGYLSKTPGPNRQVFHTMIRVWPGSVNPVWPSGPHSGVNGSVAHGVRSTRGQATPDVVRTHSGHGHTQAPEFDYGDDPADE